MLVKDSKPAIGPKRHHLMFCKLSPVDGHSDIPRSCNFLRSQAPQSLCPNANLQLTRTKVWLKSAIAITPPHRGGGIMIGLDLNFDDYTKDGVDSKQMYPSKHRIICKLS